MSFQNQLRESFKNILDKVIPSTMESPNSKTIPNFEESK